MRRLKFWFAGIMLMASALLGVPVLRGGMPGFEHLGAKRIERGRPGHS